MFDHASERGQGTIEYVLLLVLIAIVLIGALSLLGNSLETVFYGIAEALHFGCGEVSKQTFRSYAGEGGEAQGGLLVGEPERGQQAADREGGGEAQPAGLREVLGGNLPSTFVADLIVHPRDSILVVATHGRGMWAIDVSSIQKK